MAHEPTPVNPPSDLPIKEFYTYVEVAELFDVSQSTVRGWVWKKRLATVRDGAHRYVSHDEVIRLTTEIIGRTGETELARVHRRTKLYRNGLSSIERLRKTSSWKQK